MLPPASRSPSFFFKHDLHGTWRPLLLICLNHDSRFVGAVFLGCRFFVHIRTVNANVKSLRSGRVHSNMILRPFHRLRAFSEDKYFPSEIPHLEQQWRDSWEFMRSKKKKNKNKKDKKKKKGKNIDKKESQKRRGKTEKGEENSWSTGTLSRRNTPPLSVYIFAFPCRCNPSTIRFPVDVW